MAARTGHEKVLTLVKAQPHIGEQHGESVCCAGVTPEGKWRRLYPVIYRWLDNDKRFGRWDWIEYDWRQPSSDKRPESRHVQEDSIQIRGRIAPRERASFLNPLIVGSTLQAAASGHTLCLLRPVSPNFSWGEKTEKEIADERVAYMSVCQQSSLFQKSTPRPIDPCPYKFTFRFKDDIGKPHRFTCDDWETTAMFSNFRAQYGEKGALSRMDETFNDRYPTAGMAFALGTHSRRPDQWLLVGVIRLDSVSQQSLF